MKHSVSDLLQASIDAYIRHFETMGAYGAAVFGISVFVVLRSSKIVKDDSLTTIVYPWMLFLTGLLGAALVSLSHLAKNIIASFFVDALYGRVSFQCAIDGRSDPTEFFLECYRGVLKGFVQAELVIALLATTMITIWFYLQIKELRK